MEQLIIKKTSDYQELDEFTSDSFHNLCYYLSGYLHGQNTKSSYRFDYGERNLMGAILNIISTQTGELRPVLDRTTFEAYDDFNFDFHCSLITTRFMTLDCYDRFVEQFGGGNRLVAERKWSIDLFNYIITNNWDWMEIKAVIEGERIHILDADEYQCSNCILLKFSVDKTVNMNLCDECCNFSITIQKHVRGRNTRWRYPLHMLNSS